MRAHRPSAPGPRLRLSILGRPRARCPPAPDGPVRQDDLEDRNRVTQAAAPRSTEPAAPGVDRPAHRAPDRVYGDDRKGEALRVDEVFEVFPGHARFHGDGPAVGVEGDDAV